MCRNIRPLFHFEPPVTSDEVRNASLQFVRKVSGFTKPSAANQASFDQAVDEVAAAVHRLMGALVTTRRPRTARSRLPRHGSASAKRYGRPPAAEA